MLSLVIKNKTEEVIPIARTGKADLTLPHLSISSEVPKDQIQTKPLDNHFQSSIIDLNDLLIMDLPKKKRFLPWLSEGGLVMIFGPRGIGKTYFVLSLVQSLTTGGPFMKWKASSDPTGVLLVDGEMPLNLLRDRFRQFFHDGQLPGKPFRLLSQERVYELTGGDLNLTNPSLQSEILKLLDKSPDIRVLILDNISSLFMGLDENVKREWEIVIRWLLHLRSRGISVIQVHHSGKSGSQRGTSGREDQLDTVIKLEEVPGQIDITEARFIVRFTKSRGSYGPDIEPFEAKLNLEASNFWECKPYQESTFGQMIRLIKEEGITTVNEMAVRLKMTDGYISRMKNKGIQDGILKKSRKFELV